MPLRNRPAATSHLHLQVPSAQTAVFQHSPSPGSKLRREWEPGCQPPEVYERELAPWRNGLRIWLVRRLEVEKVWIAEWQMRVRTPGRDRYFYWTAIFGTHTFFMAFLPVLFFLGYLPRGRGLLNVTGLGIWLSSLFKDLACTPRPYSPPMVRLTMSTHAHEYGFPSSHSTNSVSIALFFAEWLYSSKSQIGSSLVVLGWAFLTVYTFSVVGGRLYTGMHSIADVVGGSLLGVFCWGFWQVIARSTESWVSSGSWAVPTIMLPLTLAAVHYHPEPVDYCPCFEDSIAVLATILGITTGQWYWVRQLLPPVVFERRYVDEGWIKASMVGVMRIVIGIATIFLWRLVAKSILLRVLPPIFRTTSRIFDVELPHRKFYTPATDYTGHPPTPFRTVPSFLDLQTGDAETPGDTADVSPDGEGSHDTSPISRSSSLTRPSLNMTSTSTSTALATGTARSNGHEHDALKHKREKIGDDSSGTVSPVGAGRGKRRTRIDRAKYDAEVLTKVGVYAGIGWLCSAVAPYIFEFVERNLGL